MSLVINTNISALKAQRNLAVNTAALAKSIQRLSSGYQINSSKDNAAGLQISSKLTSQIRGNAQAIQNAQDGISMLGVVEGAYNAMLDHVQWIRELTVQFANDTNGVEQRDAIKKEIFARIDDMEKIEDATQFNGKQLFSEEESAFSSGGNTPTNAEGIKVIANFDTYDILALEYGGNVAAYESGRGYAYKQIKIQLGANSSSNLDSLKISKAFAQVYSKYWLTDDPNDVDADPFEDNGVHTPQQMARAYLTRLDSFSSLLTAKLGTVGTFQNQLTGAIDNLTVTNENYAASKSRIMDVDAAKESANLTRNQILQQASASLLTQANQQPQLALQLLGGGR